MKRRVVVFAVLILLLLLFLGLTFPRLFATTRLQAAIHEQLPTRSSRHSVEQFLDDQGLGDEQVAFDYPGGDSRQGTLIFGAMPQPLVFRKLHDLFPSFISPEVEFVFWFDHKGPEGKLISYQVSDKPIQIPPP